MKKFGLIILIIILICIFAFGVKSLLDVYSQQENEIQNVSNYIDEGWEVEAEYNYNGTISENELEYFESENITK